MDTLYCRCFLVIENKTAFEIKGEVKTKLVSSIEAIYPDLINGEMAKSHSGMGISSKQFNLTDAYLSQSLTDHGVKDVDKANLARLLQPLKPEIIEK